MDVTIIISIHNSSKYLRRCFDSLIIQSGVSMEFICVDDGSTDSSLSICKEYVSKDDRIRRALYRQVLHIGGHDMLR